MIYNILNKKAAFGKRNALNKINIKFYTENAFPLQKSPGAEGGCYAVAGRTSQWKPISSFQQLITA